MTTLERTVARVSRRLLARCAMVSAARAACPAKVRLAKALQEARSCSGRDALAQVQAVLDVQLEGVRDQPCCTVRSAYQARSVGFASPVGSVTTWNQGDWSAAC